MTGKVLLAKAAALLGPESYDRNSTQAAINPHAKQFHLSSLLERANRRCRSGHVPIYGDPANVVAAKALLCRHLKVPHLMVWEERERPDWATVKAVLLEAKNG